MKDITFYVKCGEWFLIVGYNGSGKLMMVCLIDGLLEVEFGEIVIDG